MYSQLLCACRKMWSVSLVWLQKRPPQVGQATCFSCVWLRRCSFSLCLLRTVVLHPGQQNGQWSPWSTKWSVVTLVNKMVSGHPGQQNGQWSPWSTKWLMVTLVNKMVSGHPGQRTISKGVAVGGGVEDALHCCPRYLSGGNLRLLCLALEARCVQYIHASVYSPFYQSIKGSRLHSTYL